jgi:extracellular factor (EF) 3-hydroxypalmitic acid methyl ester biosynthesis protein
MNDRIRREAYEVLEQAQGMIELGLVTHGMHELMGSLNEIRRRDRRSLARVISREDISRHPLSSVIHKDPLTYHAFSRPRGYPGDAELLDHIYGVAQSDGISGVAREVNEYCLGTGACRSVRARRDILAALIDQVAEERPDPRIVSIACGHLREATLSSAITENRIGELIAVDQDARSLAAVEASNPGKSIRTVVASVRNIISGRLTFSDVDLVYAAGLYDYLELPVARRLTARMFEMLGRGGRLLVANFAPNLREIGYMETFMDWHLIYRNEVEMVEVAAEIDRKDVASIQVFRDEPGNLVFMEIVRG